MSYNLCWCFILNEFFTIMVIANNWVRVRRSIQISVREARCRACHEWAPFVMLLLLAVISNFCCHEGEKKKNDQDKLCIFSQDFKVESRDRGKWRFSWWCSRVFCREHVLAWWFCICTQGRWSTRIEKRLLVSDITDLLFLLFQIDAI